MTHFNAAAAAAAKSLQSCLILCDPIDSSPPGSPPRPWDSPGRNTGVGCHFLLQCMKVKSEREVAQSCLTPSDPMDCSLPGPSIHGIFQARVLEWVAIAFSGKAPVYNAGDPGLIPGSGRSPGEGNAFSCVQLLSRVRPFVTPWTVAHQASLSITNSRSLLKLMSIESVMLSNHLVLCRPILLLPSVFPSIRVFSNELVLCIRWPKYWSFNISNSPSNEYCFVLQSD